MPLMLPLLAIDIKNAFDEVEKIGIADPSRDLHWELGKRLATAIDKYIKMGIVQVNTDTPNIVIMPGQATPYGATITPGKPVMASTRGTGIGKVI